MKTIFEILEMDEIQKQIKSYCASTLGKNKVDSFAIENDEEELFESLEKVNEAMKLISLQGKMPLGGLSDIHMIVEKAQRDGTLMGDELMNVAAHLECIHRVSSYMSSSEVETHYLKELSNGLVDNQHLYDEIQRCIGIDGSVLDHASSTLKSIRKNISQIQINIRHKMESLLKDSKDMLSIDNITTKNDRLVLPVKVGHKNELGGLIHGHSATGQTVYVEPEAILNMNNQLSDFQIQEREEVNRILYALSQLIKSHYYHFHFNLEILEELDFIFAKGYYGHIHDCCIPSIKKEGTQLLFKGARHPLIDPQKVVSNNIVLEDHRMLLISGSNTGGKTVTLKTTGLLSLMALCGLPIPCHEAIVPLFDSIYVDLGDEQSIEQSLSTFSSHMKKIIHILDLATPKSLIILDEIGSGTDPQEGESLAEAILNRLLEIGSFVFATTHFGKLKTFAKEHEEILMASVSFDLEKMRPTYQLKLDSIGKSYAIEIASLLGMDDNIIDQANAIKEASLSEHEKLMEELQQKEEQLSIKEEELQSLLNENQKLEKQYRHQLNQVEKEKEKLIEEAKDNANQLILDAKKEIDVIVEQLQASSLKQHEIINAKHTLDNLTYNDESQQVKQAHILKIGDHVKITKMNQEGDVIQILNNHMINVSVSGLTIKLHEDDVVYMHPKTKVKKVKKEAMRKSTIKKTGSYEVNVIGKRFEEAMSIVDKFLDDALVMGYPHVRIVHGMGTGVLRNGIRKMLERNRHVVSYRDGGPNEGGLGATLVYFE